MPKVPVGVEDSPDGFPWIDEDTEQAARETMQRVVRTRRGTVREFPERYVDLAEYVQSRASQVPVQAIAESTREDLSEDPRFRSVRVTIGTANAITGRVPFKIEATRVTGETLALEEQI
jgi:hypothetical protein